MHSVNRIISSLGLSLLAFNAFAEFHIEHSQGTQSFSQVPQKVLTFDLASLDTFDALGIPVRGLPQEFAKGHLAKYTSDKYQNIGSLFEPDYEIVAAEQADLIIVANRSSKVYKNLAKLAPTFDLSIVAGNPLKQVKSNSGKIARIFGNEALLKEKLAKIDSKIAQVQTLAKTSGNALFILTNGGKISAYGLGSRFGWLHSELGLTPAIKDIKEATHGDPISFEFILDTNPDWIFVLDRDAVIGKSTGAAKALLDNELINKSTAAKNQQIVYLNGMNWYILAGGITALDASVQEVLSALEK